MTRTAQLEVERAEQMPSLSPTVTGHVLVTEPQNFVLARQEQIERGYEELEEANRR